MSIIGTFAQSRSKPPLFRFRIDLGLDPRDGKGGIMPLKSRRSSKTKPWRESASMERDLGGVERAAALTVTDGALHRSFDHGQES